MQQASTHSFSVHRGFVMTYILITINIIIYLFLVQRGGTTYENLILFGAKENGLIADGQLGRLFFPMFLHANWMHLGFNMYGLFQVGRYLETLAGSRNLLIVYIVSGIMGNLCSFALSPSLSVGASGSLFGILLSLYVLQKYEERLAQEAGVEPPRTTLGSMILLNGVISFVIPNIDWACHLGGAIGGVFMGLAIVMRHRWNLRVMRAVRYLGGSSGLMKPAFFERESVYIGILIAISLAFSCGIFRIGIAERAFGRGVLAAAENYSEKRDPEMMKEFSLMLGSAKSDANPERLLQGALRLHNQGKFRSAILIYEVLIDMNMSALGTAEFNSESTKHLLTEIQRLGTLNLKPDEHLLNALSSDFENKENDIDICRKPAELFKSLGFFDDAAKLYRCAFALSPLDVNLASGTVESLWLAGNKDDVLRFVEWVDEIYDQKKATPQFENL